MPQYSFAQLEGLWIQAGGGKALAPLMAAIALAESSGNSDALNPSDNNGTQTSVGLWQVSTGTHQYPPAWATPEGNAQEAVAKYQSQGLGAWGTYTSGAYRQFLPSGTVLPSWIGSGLGPGPPPSSGGGLGGFVTSVITDLSIPGLIGSIGGVLKSGSAIAQAIAAVAAPLVKIAEAIDWFFHPAHWIRLLAGVAGGVLVLGGVWQMSHAGGA